MNLSHFPYFFFWYLITSFLSFVMSIGIIYPCLCWYLYSNFALLQLFLAFFLTFILFLGWYFLLYSFPLPFHFDYFYVFFIYWYFSVKLCFCLLLLPSFLHLKLLLFSFRSFFCYRVLITYFVLLYTFSFTEMSWFIFICKK